MSLGRLNLARRSLTPGSYDSSVTLAQVQQSGFAASRRPGRWLSLKLKGQAMKRYGIPLVGNWHKYTLDHLVPLSLGGMPQDPLNIWPQLKAEAKLKDRDEAAWLRSARSSSVLLRESQSYFQKYWTR